MFLCRCSLFAKQELEQGKAFLPWQDISGFWDSSHALPCQWTQKPEGCSLARRLRRLPISLFWSRVLHLLFPKRNIYSLSPLPETHVNLSPLHTPKEKSSATFLLKTILSTVHCFALTFLGFSPWEPSFLQGREENLNHQDILNSYLSFHSSWHQTRKQCCWHHRREKAWTESPRQEQRLGFFFLLSFLPKCWWSCTSFLCFKH